MKILVIGLDGAAPELLFGDDCLTNFRQLMETGCYGRLESVIPPIAVPAWMCMATSQDPGSLGVYGFRNRGDHSYDGFGVVNSKSIQQPTIWDQIAREGGRANIIGVPPSYPPRKVNGVCVGCLLTPDTYADEYTSPPAVKERIRNLVGNYPVDVKGFRTHRKGWLLNEIQVMIRKHFAVAGDLMWHSEWDYMQFVEIGLDRLQHGFWKFHDPHHILHEPDNPYGEIIRDYYCVLDEEVGTLLDLVDGETAVLVMSDYGAQRSDGGFCVNEWLVREGLLVLNEYPREVTPFSKLDINWEKTKAWGEGGYYARVFFNVKGREPNGAIDPSDYERFRDEVKAMFEATVDEEGRSLCTRVYKPDEIYRAVRNVAPDLIVHFGDLYWRSIGGVGYGSIHVRENDTGPDDCNHALFGGFILAAPGLSLEGEITGAHLLDIAPTLLELGGYDIPDSMQGRSLLKMEASAGANSAGFSIEGGAIIHERPSVPGYTS
jgi:predicted AlkP superfamily phosphohydrolase/phosphomutase